MQIYICTCCYQEEYDTEYFHKLQLSLRTLHVELQKAKQPAQVSKE